ncbi:hypothetical protein MWU61_13170 [Loktanella sp. F6476L]|uniref:hypothetical protein n=1 Tax=Loktanella sp. F6476L TaxID=2926405 RepID=UPI001FF57693|nr:hypothetical protein [Loktanella sp. F6476L]MCK0121498.1 hypothetical protein [Loktanella sp. F6476L]
MIFGAIGAVFAMFQSLLVLLIILLGFFINRRIAGFALIGYFAVLLLPPFTSWAWYSARLAWNGGFHERVFDGVKYRVKLDEENGFDLAGTRHAYRRNQLRFSYRVPETQSIDFWLQQIDGDSMQPSGCPVIGYRYGLNEVSISCSIRDDRSLYSDYVFETGKDAPIQVQLVCDDARDWQKDQMQNCSAYFQIERFFIGAWLSLNDPNDWSIIAAGLSQIIAEQFVIEDAPRG